jgi:hypothetical protein
VVVVTDVTQPNGTTVILQIMCVTIFQPPHAKLPARISVKSTPPIIVGLFLLFYGLLLQASGSGTQHSGKGHAQIASPINFLNWAIPNSAPVTAFAHVTVIPMDREQVFGNQTVIIRAGHIEEIGRTGDIAVPANATVIDGTGKYLIPGLIDMRVHLCSPGELLLYLANGVTMVRSLDSRPQHLAWREGINKGTILGPIIYAAGPTISGPVTSAQAKQMVMQQIRAGYEAVETSEDLSADAFHGITAAARMLGVSVFGGVNANIGLKDTVAGPQFFSIEQSEQLAKVAFSNNPDSSEADISRAAADIREGKIWFAPSLVSFANTATASGNSLATSSLPGTEYLPFWLTREWSLPTHNDQTAAENSAARQREWALYKRIVSIMHTENVPMILGSDSVTTGTVPGFSIQQELTFLVESGLTPFEALSTATKNASDWFVHPEGGGVFGTITLHERADLVLLDANPLVDIHNVGKVRGVMVQGRWLPQSELQKMLNALRYAYGAENRFLTSTARENPALTSKYLKQNDPYHGLAHQLMLSLVTTKGVSAFKLLYASLKKIDPTSSMLEEAAVNQLGRRLLELKKTADAEAVFRLNIQSHPVSAPAYDGIARAYLVDGNRTEAIHYFKESVRVDPSFRPASLALEELERTE